MIPYAYAAMPITHRSKGSLTQKYTPLPHLLIPPPPISSRTVTLSNSRTDLDRPLRVGHFWRPVRSGPETLTFEGPYQERFSDLN